MGKKLEDNGLWESNRMLLPQHVTQSLKRNQEEHRLVRRELTEEQVVELDGLLRQSLANKVEIRIDIFSEYTIRQVKGRVTFMDGRLKRVRIELENGFEWIDFVDILDVQLDSAETLW